MTKPAILLESLRYAWSKTQGDLLCIDHFSVAPGEKLFLFGASGSGKSTLLNLLAGIIIPQAGSINILGTSVNTLGQAARDRFRARHIGMIFQQFNLIPYLDVVDNLRLRIEFLPAAQRQAALAQIPELLTRLDLESVARQQAYRLSVGQQQRVALARALLGKPDLIIADEPTSALDAERREEFMQLLFELLDENTCLIFVSHDHQLRVRFDRVVDINIFHAHRQQFGVQV